MYADTLMELPPLQQTALTLLETLAADGFKTRVVTPPTDDRFFVYMFGRGVPPPSNRFRWCTSQIKIEPMEAALTDLRDSTGQKLLMITGVRIGESAARDQRIAVSCSRDSGECGQGWFQIATDESIADTLAPLLHWRLCHVYDWLYFEQAKHGYDVSDIALIYGDGEVRTGCIGCPLASRDVALERLVKKAGWKHLLPLLELKPLYRELKMPRFRLRKTEAEKRKSDGLYAKNAQRLGPLTMDARAYGLKRVLDIQSRAGIELITPTDENRIRQMWAGNVWPNGWDGDEVTGDKTIPMVRVTKDQRNFVTQAMLGERRQISEL
jgi:DNA sulfur modification protein DndC